MIKVSVIITVFNDPFVNMAIESILNQSFLNFEIVVVDDGSNQECKELLVCYNSNKIKIILNEHIGRAAALNLGIHKSCGEYIAILDSDDIALKNRLMKQVKILDENSDVGIVGSSNKKIINSKGEIVREEHSGVYNHHDIKRKLINENPMFHSSVMYRRNLYDLVNGYDTKLFVFIDYDFYIRCSQYTQLLNIDVPLTLKRIHGDQYFFGNQKNIKNECISKSQAILNFRKVIILKALSKIKEVLKFTLLYYFAKLFSNQD